MTQRVTQISTRVSTRITDQRRNHRHEARLFLFLPSTVDIQLSFTYSEAHAGVDQEALLADLEAEVAKVEPYLGKKPKQVSLAAPQEAQGEVHIIQWLLDFASDPKNSILYARLFLFAVNKILESRTKKVVADKHGKAAKEEKRPTPVTVKALGKELALPTATRVIEEFLKHLHSQS